MIIEIPNENSIVKWKNDDKDEWNYAEISDLILAYEKIQGERIKINKMRLIDANALMPSFVQKAFTMQNRHGVKLGENWLLDYNDIKDVINLAPTIKTFTITDIEEQYRKGLEKGLSERETERPKGEWNYIQAGMCVCPFCGAMPHKEYKNFCANCGADMRGNT